jgi:hypothetical protein
VLFALSWHLRNELNCHILLFLIYSIHVFILIFYSDGGDAGAPRAIRPVFSACQIVLLVLRTRCKVKKCFDLGLLGDDRTSN